MERDGAEALFARLDDLLSRAASGEPAISDFLSPREQHRADTYLRALTGAYTFFGGYGDAERRRLIIFPSYMEDAYDVSALSDYGYEPPVGAVWIEASGYRKLSHRDYLGALLGLGLERAVIGDVIVCGETGEAAYAFCDAKLCRFISTELVKVANDSVKAEQIALEDVKVPERRFEEITDTVASAKLDCIVGALCSLSREKARAAVETGLVELEHETEERPDRTVCAPCTVSVRGYGKYRLLSVNDKTKKGRLRLVAEKYI